jgi:pimeloyl-ACP methyl ester carboxylesterase
VPFAVLRASGTARGTVIRIGGGPMPELHAVARVAGGGLRRDRDVVMFDYRGMGHSQPVCPDLGREYLAALLQPLDTAASLQARREVAARCAAWASANDIDLAAYNARNMARDVVAIAAGLGLQSWSIDAVSFGTIVAQHVMRLAPPGLYAVVLRGPVPLDLEAQQVNGVARSLGLMATWCAAEPGCAARHPDPLGAYARVHQRLEAEPLRAEMPVDELFATGELYVTGTVFQRLVAEMLYARAALAAVPLLAQELDRGQPGPAAAIVGVLGSRARQLNGVNFAAQCEAMGPWAARLQRQDGQHRADDDYFRVELASRCPALGVPPAPASDREPVRSALPTLLVVGEHDPVTPPEYAAAIARHLAAAHTIELPGRGHEFPAACTDRMVADFLDAPHRAPDSGCFSALPAVAFIGDVRPVTGVRRLASAASGRPPRDAALLGIPLAVLAFGAVAWPLAAGARRLRGRRDPLSADRFDRRAGVVLGALLLVAMVFAVGLGWAVRTAVAENPLMLLFGVPGWAAPLLLLPWLLLATALAASLIAAQAWREGRWSRWRRSRYAALAMAGIALAVLLLAWEVN